MSSYTKRAALVQRFLRGETEPAVLSVPGGDKGLGAATLRAKAESDPPHFRYSIGKENIELQPFRSVRKVFFGSKRPNVHRSTLRVSAKARLRNRTFGQFYPPSFHTAHRRLSQSEEGAGAAGGSWPALSIERGAAALHRMSLNIRRIGEKAFIAYSQSRRPLVG